MRHLIVLSILSMLSAPALAGKPSVKTMPPVVVKTVPASGETSVDAKLKEIKVTFSKDMKTKKMWSFVQSSPDTFPKTGTPKYTDKRTIVLPVTLQPKKTYVIWINSGKHNSFRDVSNNPAVPYLLVFETR
jgi:hypothetical protein